MTDTKFLANQNVKYLPESQIGIPDLSKNVGKSILNKTLYCFQMNPETWFDAKGNIIYCAGILYADDFEDTTDQKHGILTFPTPTQLVQPGNDDPVYKDRKIPSNTIIQDCFYLPSVEWQGYSNADSFGDDTKREKGHWYYLFFLPNEEDPEQYAPGLWLSEADNIKVSGGGN